MALQGGFQIVSLLLPLISQLHWAQEDLGSQGTKISELNIPDPSVQLGCGTMKSSTAYSVQNELGSPAPKKRVKSHTNQRIVRISKLFFSCSSVCSVLPSLKYYKWSPKVAAEESIDSLLV
jgi:hypothetical protein